MIRLDAHELDPFGSVLEQAGADAHREGEAIVAKGSLKIKNDARRLAPGTGHAKLYPASITYDITTGPDWIEGEIGPIEGRKQRGLGNLLEYGGPRNAPHPHLEPALDAEEPRFYEQSELLAARLMGRYG